jgi:crotonobetainyl-CoA:carnitine CoA-transferase CaiB-like acyl-CoA transferase
MPAPLEGIKVLDFTRYQNGPHATVMLSDMGAEIIKVEMPGGGDPGRSLGVGPDGFCSYFETLNRGKRSITVNLYNPGSKEIIHKLIEQVDVLAENFRPGFLDRLGYGYDELRKVNPRLIYATNSGFGPVGRWRDRGSFDVVAQGMSGAMVANGGGPDNPPIPAPWGLADQTGAMTFAYGIMGAIIARERFGVGQRVDVSQLGAMVMVQALSVQAFLHNERQPTRPPGTPLNPIFAWYKASDGGYLSIGILDPKHWPRLCNALERPDMVDDERCAEAFARYQNAEWLAAELQSAISKQPREHWLVRLCAEDIPCGPVYDYAGMIQDPQFWENGYLQEVEHPNFPGHRAVGIPVVLSETPSRIQGVAPELGQDTETILLDLGFSWADIERFHDAGVTSRAGREAGATAAG